MSALTLKTMLPELEVTLVHSSDLPPIGVGESTTSLLPRFLHDGLRLDRQAFYDEVRPTWKLGIRFDWGPPGTDPFYYPFDRPLDGREGTLGKENAYYYFADGRLFSHYTVMMDLEKSPCVPRPDGTYDMDHQYGYHIENRTFIRHLRSQAAGRGIGILDREVLHVDIDPAGNVAGLRLDDDTSITADLYVDCSGFASRLLGQVLQEPFLDFSGSLLCDTAVTGSWQRDRGVLPYTNCQTMNHGWCWQIELADRVNRGYVYSSQFCSEDEAICEMRAGNPEMGDNFGTVKFRSGRYQRFWVNNVAAIGNAAGFVEPLESTGLHMVAVTARTLGQALVDTDRRVTDSMQREINHYIGTQWDDIRDFLAIHFAFNQRLDTPFWQHCRAQTDLAGAARLLDFYRESGPSSMGSELLPSNSIFRHAGYLTMLIGLQIPSDYTFEPPEHERRQWEQIRQYVHDTAARALAMDDGLAMLMPRAG
jgi:tryptophan halogenase